MSVSHVISPKKASRRPPYLRLAFTEQQLHAGLDEFRVCDEFENNCGTVSRPQQVLWMVDGNDTDCLPNRLYVGAGRSAVVVSDRRADGTYATVQHSLIIWLHGGIVVQYQNLSFEPSHR
jgi:hypothetical protein